MFKVNNRNARKRCKIGSKLTIKTIERHFGVYIVIVKHVSHIFVVIPSVDFEQENVCWGALSCVNIVI